MALAVFALVGSVQPAPATAAATQDRPRPGATRGRRAPERPSGDVYYPNCDAARAAGVAPIRRGDPGYRPALDRDNDGVACEPKPRWRR